MKKSLPFILTVFVVLLSGCAKIYYSPEAASKAAQHGLIAIVPPKVSIEARKKVDANALMEQQKTESLNFQKEMYSWFLKRKMQDKITVNVQDVETTNVLLQRAGYFDDAVFTPVEIAKLLGVDGVVTSSYALSKPMSTGAAIASTFLIGFGTTNSATVSLEIHDKDTASPIFNFNHKLSAGLGSSPAMLVDGLMRQASKKMPYVRKTMENI